MLRLLFRSVTQVDRADRVVTYLMLLTGNLQFAEKLVATPEITTTINRYLRTGMSPRQCAMRIIGPVIARAIGERSEAHYRDGEKEKSCRADRESLTTMIQCICDRIERWRHSGALDRESAAQLCKQVYDALRSKSGNWKIVTIQAAEMKAAA